jgi:hypothetical protein
MSGAVATLLDHTLYRSRLEARWSCVFKSLGWRAEAEPPIPCAPWLPDFMLLLARPVAVEVKPAFNPAELAAIAAPQVMAGVGWKGDVLLLGATFAHPTIGGVMRQLSPDGTLVRWREAAWAGCQACSSPTLVADQRCIVCGAEGDVAGPAPDLLVDAWKAAGRRSRWRGEDVSSTSGRCCRCTSVALSGSGCTPT